MTNLLRRPDAWVSIVLSLAALALVLGYVATVGVVHQEDEGPAARIFQLLMAADLLAIGFFGVRWIPTAPKAALAVVALQVVLAVIPVATVVVLEM